jgi:hypothetical protein
VAGRNQATGGFISEAPIGSGDQCCCHDLSLG